jgi:hypothetical protein
MNRFRKLMITLTLIFVVSISYGQYGTTSANTSGLKYNLLEVAVSNNEGWTPDATQDVLEKVLPMYPRTILAFWHSNFIGTDPMALGVGVTGPYMSAMSITCLPCGTVDRALISSTLSQSRPFESKVATRDSLTPKIRCKARL